MTNKANIKLSFFHRHLKGCLEQLKETDYFSSTHYFMEYGAPVWDPHQNYNSKKFRRCSIERQGSWRAHIEDTPVLQRIFMSWDGHLLLKDDRMLYYSFYTIIYGVAEVPFEGVLNEAYKGTRRKLNMEFRRIGHTTIQYGQLFSHKTREMANCVMALQSVSNLSAYS